MPFGSQPTNEDIATLILAWAKEHHPDKYTETLKVAARPQTFRAYLLRLVEIRCESDRAWMSQVPVMVLEETRVMCRVKDHRTDAILEFKGARAGSRAWAFRELSLTAEEFHELKAVKLGLDLEWM